MNVTREDLNDTNAIIRVKITPEDYGKNVASTIEKTRKNAKTPGFRPGHVPVGVIKKQYGKSILGEELNRIVNQALNRFITEHKIEILGNPIPLQNEEIKGDFNAPDEFEFSFEIGLVPAISLDKTLQAEFNYVKVNVDSQLISKQIDDLRRRYGKLVSSEQISATDLVMAQFTELNVDGSIKENGIVHSSTISMEFIEDEVSKKALIGKKAADSIQVNPALVSKGGKDTAAMLGITEEQLSEISSIFELKVTEIRHMELADLSQELYDKVFGEGDIKSEEELNSRIKVDLEKMFSTDSDRLLTRSVYDRLVSETNLELPSDFLKRWIQISSEKPITLEEIESQFDGYEKSMKWQLIQGHIFKKNDIKLKNEEVIDFTKNLLVSQYAQYGIPAPEEKELIQSAIQVLENKEESARIFDMLSEVKLTEYFKSTIKLNDKLVSYDEFIEIASK